MALDEAARAAPSPAVDAVAAGHHCLDIIPGFGQNEGYELADYVMPGRLMTVGPATFTTGGAVSNVGVTLYWLEVRTRLMGKVGDDLPGRAIVDTLGGFDRDLVQDMIVVKGEASSYTLVIDPPGLDRSFLHYPGTNATFSEGDVRSELLSDARCSISITRP